MSSIISKSTSKNIKFGVLISYITLIVSIIGNILVTKKVLNYVGVSNYGLFSFVNSITTWLTVISNALGASFIRFATIEKEETGGEGQVKTLYNRLFLVIALVAVTLAAGLLLGLYLGNVQLFNYSKEESDILYVLFASSIIQVGITIGFSVYTLFINYKKKFIFARALTLVTNLTLFAGNWLIAYFTRNIIYIGMYAAFQALASIVIQIIYVKCVLKETGFTKTKIVDKTLFRRIAVFSSILLFGAIVSQISNQVDKTILGSMGLANDVAIYQLGQSFSTYVIVLSSSVAAVYIPTVNELVVKRKDQELNDLFLRVSKFQIIVVTMVVFGFLAAGRDFTELWVGNEVKEATVDGAKKVYQIAAAWLILLLCSETMNLSIEIQRARNKHLFRCLTFFGLSVGNIGLSLFLIYLFGRDKAVEACLLGSVITSFLSNWVALNIYNAKNMRLPIFRYFFILVTHAIYGAVGFLGTYFLFKIEALHNLEYSFLSLILKGVIFVAIYGLLLLIFDRNFIKSILFERGKMKKGESKEGSVPTDKVSLSDASNKMQIIINTREIYYFKKTPEDLFIELGMVLDIGHDKIRNVLKAFVRFFPNMGITNFLCNKFVPKIYPKHIIEAINSDKNICIFDAAVTPELLQYGLSKKPNLIVYCWNQIDKDFFRRYYEKLMPKSHIFTYSRLDAKLYEIGYLPEPLLKLEGLVEPYSKAKFDYDFYFLGRLKDKEKPILDTCKTLYEMGYKLRIDVLEPGERDFSNYPFINILDKYLTYEEYLSNVSKAKCILEIVSQDNPNVTWRPFESFLYERKLVTNASNALTEPYLTEDNVLVIDVDNPDTSKIKDFMSKGYDYKSKDEKKWNHSMDDFLNYLYIKFYE